MYSREAIHQKKEIFCGDMYSLIIDMPRISEQYMSLAN